MLERGSVFVCRTPATNMPSMNHYTIFIDGVFEKNEHIYLDDCYLFHGEKLSDDQYYRYHPIKNGSFVSEDHDTYLPKSIMNDPSKAKERIKKLLVFL